MYNDNKYFYYTKRIIPVFYSKSTFFYINTINYICYIIYCILLLFFTFIYYISVYNI